jgi:DNA uptake protein ComE-like DNA-binding protein
MNNERRQTIWRGEEKLMKAFLAGFGIGTVVGLLFAPQDGAKTRRVLSEYGSNLLDKFGDVGKQQPDSAKQNSEGEAVADVLNTASKQELMSVDGIGKGTAKRIINNRPYETRAEVVQAGVAEEILDRVKEQLIDKPAI